MQATLSAEQNAQAKPANRTRTLGVRISESEFATLEQRAWQSGKTVADWARDRLLVHMERAETDRITAHVFTELIGLEMLLMGFFSPLLQGRQISPEQYQEIVRSVQAGKGKRAKELLAQRLGQEEK
jgi:hypothetical protein